MGSAIDKLDLRGGRCARPLCIYHGNCADGFTAAWAVWKAFDGRIDFHAGVYQEPPPDVSGRDVIIVDFSYKRPVLESMLAPGDMRQAMTILILDHHKTAAEDLAGLASPHGVYDAAAWRAEWESWAIWPVRAVFDMKRSGARLAWDFFHPGKPVPALVRYVEDRDLWSFVLPGSRAFNANLFSHAYDFDKWDELARLAETDAGLQGMTAAGEAIERKHHKDVFELVATLRRRMTIGGISVPVANLPYTMTSDAGQQMAMLDATKIGACYWDTAEGRVFSLRSTDDGPDVSAIAKRYGGGGHFHAAGFRMPIGWEGDRLGAA